MYWTGRVISRYRILEKVGEGGMGVVYKSEDLKLKRIVAVKVLKPELIEKAESKKRFLREAQTAAALDHSNVCTVYEMDEAEGLHFIVMEYVQGENLKQRIGLGPIPIDTIISVAIQIADAVSEAHEKNIIHRDIKPSNILITDRGVVKVSDFGLAKLVRPEGETTPADSDAVTTSLTEDGRVLGTVEYMSPEQVRGDKLDHRSDVFSFGVVLYEMVTARTPFKENSVIATAGAILHKQAEPMARFNSDVPWELERIVRKMLAKDQEDRYQTLREVLVDLRKVRKDLETGEGISAIKVEQLTKPRRRLAKLALLVGGVLALVLLALGLWFYYSPKQALPFAKRDWMLISAFDNQTTDAIFDNILNEALYISIEQSQYVNVVPLNKVQEVLKRMRKEGVKKIDEELGREICQREGFKALLAGSISQVGSNYYLAVRLIDPNTANTAKAFQKVIATRDQILPILSKLAIEVRESLGETLKAISESNKELAKVTTSSLSALRFLSEARRIPETKREEAIELYKDAIKLDQNFAMAYRGLAIAYWYTGKRSEAKNHMARAYELRDKVTHNEKLAIEADYHYYFDRLDESVKSYEMLIELYPDKNYGAFYNLGSVYQRLVQFEKALGAFKEAMRIRGTGLDRVASIHFYLNNYEEAIKLFKQDPPVRWAPRRRLAMAYLAVGQIEQARRQCEELASDEGIEEKISGREGLAFINLYEGKFAAAQKDLQEAMFRTRNSTRSGDAIRRYQLAMLFSLQGKKNEALREADKVMKLSNDIEDNWILAVFAKLYARANQITKAEQLLSKLDARLKEQKEQSNQNKALRDLAQGEIERAKGNLSGAMDLFKLAAAYPTLNSYLEIQESLAAAYLEAKQFEEARRGYEALLKNRAVGFDINNVPHYWILAHYWLGKVYEGMKQPDKATSYFQRLVTIWKEADQEIPLLKDAKQQIRVQPRASQATTLDSRFCNALLFRNA